MRVYRLFLRVSVLHAVSFKHGNIYNTNGKLHDRQIESIMVL